MSFEIMNLGILSVWNELMLSISELQVLIHYSQFLHLKYVINPMAMKTQCFYFWKIWILVMCVKRFSLCDGSGWTISGYQSCLWITNKQRKKDTSQLYQDHKESVEIQHIGYCAIFIFLKYVEEHIVNLHKTHLNPSSRITSLSGRRRTVPNLQVQSCLCSWMAVQKRWRVKDA